MSESEWTKLWENYDVSKAPDSWFAKIKAVGDRREQKLEAIKEVIKTPNTTNIWAIVQIMNILGVKE